MFIVVGGWHYPDRPPVILFLGTDRKGRWQWASTHASATVFATDTEAQREAAKHPEYNAQVVARTLLMKTA